MADTHVESIFDIPSDEATEARLDAAAEADYAAGRVIPHKKLAEWLTRLAKGERVRRPKP